MKIYASVFFVLLAFFLTVPDISLAQSTDALGLTAGLVPEACESGTKCNACHLVQLANTIIKWLIGVLVMVFVLLVAVAGFKLVTSAGNVSARDDAKKMMTNALVGFILVLAAWLIVDTIMRGLTPDNGTINGRLWYQSIVCDDGAFKQVTPTTEGNYETVPEGEIDRSAQDGGTAGGGGGVTPPGAGVDSTELTHSQAVAQLNSGGFRIQSSGGCTDRARRNCTSLQGVKKNTITRINELQSAIGTKLILTGGTEVGHAAGTYSHANGYKIDFRYPQPALDNHITRNFTSIGGNKYRDSKGNIYWRHGTPLHWDVTITN